MCGLVGLAGHLVYADEALMKRLLIFDYFRGTDSTGMAAIRDNGKVYTAKVDSNPITLFDMKSFDTALNAYGSSAFIGHNRATTSGATSPANAHPFTYGSITGAQNGTLDKESHRDLEYMLLDEFDVDTQALYASINAHGLKDTISQIRGAWALTYYDADRGTLNFIRNDQRPLWFAFSKDFKKLFWASEYAIIQAAVSIGGKEDLASNEEGFTYFPFAVDTHYEFDLEALADGQYTDFGKDAIKGIIKGKEPKPVTTMGSASPFVKTVTTTKTPTLIGSSHGSANHGTRGPSAKGDISIVVSNEKPFGDILDKEAFAKLTNGDCSFCGAEVEFDDPGVTVYVDESIVLCKKCSGHSTQASTVVVTDIMAYA